MIGDVLEHSVLLRQISRVSHGFSTRLGGVSQGAFAGLNLAKNVGDGAEQVAENRRRFAEALGPEIELAEVEQVHGARVWIVDQGGPAGVEADAILTQAAGVAAAVRTADCAPILIAAQDGSAVAAVHAGWRGATLDIPGAAVESLLAQGARASQLVAAIGPTISLEAFEVGDEVISAAERALGDPKQLRTMRGPSGRWHLDLRALVRSLLERAGIPPAQIELVGGCTVQDSERYFSHRRDQGRTGRHLSAIAIRG
jgi:YfiH family protein